MEDVVLNEVMKELNWKERIIVVIFKRTFIKVYGMAGQRVFNVLYAEKNHAINHAIGEIFSNNVK